MTEAVASTTSKPKTSELDRVKQAFLKAIEEDGIVHTFEWMASWFDKVAKASIDDQIANYLAPHHNNKAAVNLHLMERLMTMTRSASNFSTSASANLFNQSLMAAMSKMINENHSGYGSGHQLRQVTDAFYAQPHIQALSKEYLEKIQS